MKIDFVSDVVCPWCAIGLASLETALSRLGDALNSDTDGGGLTLRCQPFELNPQMGPEGEDLVEHIGRKYGSSAEQVRQNQQMLHDRGAEVGVAFGNRERIVNTFDAHRLLHWAGLPEQAPGAQMALKRALLQAYQGRGEDVSRHEVLLQAARGVGLDASEAAQVLSSGRFGDEVRAAEQQWQQAGIRSVPAVIINDRYLISGGQPPEVFEQSLRRILDEARQAPNLA